MRPSNPPPLTQTLRFTEVASGARIAWARTGKPSAPTLVRASHWLTHVEHDLRGSLWSPWIARMSEHLQLVRYDERGCGLSSADDVALGIESLVEELAAVVDAHGAPRVALLGISTGAAVAVAYALRHPEKVSHLVLHGASLCGQLANNPSADTIAMHEATLRLVQLGWGRDHAAVQAMFSTLFMPDASRADLESLNEQQRQSCDGERSARVLAARVRLDMRTLAPQLRVPTLVLHSQGDVIVPLKLGVDLAAAIPGARFEILPCRNHFPLASDAAYSRFCDAICEFVREPSGTTAPMPQLTPREKELAALVARGLDNLQISAQLGLADKTVRNMLSALYAKLAVEGRAMAVVRTRDMGF
jgi:pimeloyl-ACP methyl ester carboxylesterase/DNA-binding CsgD family transcriptional regulator